MKDRVLVIDDGGMAAALVQEMLLADRGWMPVVLTRPPRFEPTPFFPEDMLMPDRPRRPSLASLLADLAALEAEAILARRPRPFRPTGNKRSRRRRKG